ncbi:MAG: hypothetical protein GPJ54_13960 [Candidatus Heimdallarchaeota archaeon]|nr:hypothetical protein [Candidatus Heimdallarchaeota archaeon]
MRKRLCKGYLILPENKGEIPARCLFLYNRPNFYTARAKLILSLKDGHMGHSSHKLWQVGIFSCNEIGHNKENHIYSVSGTDPGQIENFQSEDFDSIVIDVKVIHISIENISLDQFDNKNDSRPIVRKYD